MPIVVVVEVGVLEVVIVAVVVVTGLLQSSSIFSRRGLFGPDLHS